MRVCVRYTFRLTENKAGREAGGVGKGQAQPKKLKVIIQTYIPASAPDM